MWFVSEHGQHGAHGLVSHHHIGHTLTVGGFASAHHHRRLVEFEQISDKRTVKADIGVPATLDVGSWSCRCRLLLVKVACGLALD